MMGLQSMSKKELKKDKPNGSLNNKNFKGHELLIPAIIQDYENKDILMLGFMDKESFIKSIQTGYTWFFSRERKKIWNKGETSGNFQKIKKILLDCDKDALVFQVIQTGFACHTGNRSCFFNEIPFNEIDELKLNDTAKDLNFGNYSGIYGLGKNSEHSFDFLADLYEIISDRIKEKQENSYTYNLHVKGIDEIIKKFGEESIEVILASKYQEKNQLIYEIADLFYHLIVLMFERDIKLEEVIAELKSRHK